MIGETPLATGHTLFELGKGGLAEKPDKKVAVADNRQGA